LNVSVFVCASASEVHGSGSSSSISSSGGGGVLQQQQQGYSAASHIATASTRHREERPLTARTAANITTEEPALRTRRSKVKILLLDTLPHLLLTHLTSGQPIDSFVNASQQPQEGEFIKIPQTAETSLT
jgi:hypothetical protein